MHNYCISTYSRFPLPRSNTVILPDVFIDTSQLFRACPGNRNPPCRELYASESLNSRDSHIPHPYQMNGVTSGQCQGWRKCVSASLVSFLPRSGSLQLMTWAWKASPQSDLARWAQRRCPGWEYNSDCNHRQSLDRSEMLHDPDPAIWAAR